MVWAKKIACETMDFMPNTGEKVKEYNFVPSRFATSMPTHRCKCRASQLHVRSYLLTHSRCKRTSLSRESETNQVGGLYFQLEWVYDSTRRTMEGGQPMVLGQPFSHNNPIYKLLS